VVLSLLQTMKCFAVEQGAVFKTFVHVGLPF